MLFQHKLLSISLFCLSLFVSLCCRQNNLFTHLRMNWSRVHYLHCMQHSLDTFPKTRSKRQCREANIKGTSIRAVSRIRAQSRNFQATVRPHWSLRAWWCVIMWKDHKPQLEEKVVLCLWSTRTPYRTIKSTTRRNGWVWLLFQLIKKFVKAMTFYGFCLFMYNMANLSFLQLVLRPEEIRYSCTDKQFL